MIKRAHHIWLSQVANIPAVHLHLLLVFREAMGSHSPCNAISDMRGRKTLLSLSMWAIITRWWLSEDSVYRGNSVYNFNAPQKCHFPLLFQVYDKLTPKHFPFLSFRWQREFTNNTHSFSPQKIATNIPPLNGNKVLIGS